MKKFICRNITIAAALTPAALLAACSSWNSQSYASRDSRDTNRSSAYDPYGDGVAGGPGYYNAENRMAAANQNSRGTYYSNNSGNVTRFDNENPSQDNSSSRYNTGISGNEKPGDGTLNNQNVAKGTVSPFPSWIVNQTPGNERNQGYQDNRNRGERTGQSSNQDNWYQNQQSGQYQANNGQYPPIQDNWNNSNSGQYPQNQGNWNNSNGQYQANSGNPQNNWGDQSGQRSGNQPQYRGNQQPAMANGEGNRNGAWNDSSRVAAAQAISDPSTNPTNGNAQIGATNPTRSDEVLTRRESDLAAAGQSQQTYASNSSADSRILSLIHMKNQEEIQIGQLASSKGSDAAVRNYGEMLVRDHTSADAKVQSVASQANITLMSDAETRRLMHAEKSGTQPDRLHEKYADDSNVQRTKDPMEELRSLNGADFDRAFAEKMAKGHAKLIAEVEKAQSQVRDAQTRQLLNELLPTLKKHERMAKELPGYTETASAR